MSVQFSPGPCGWCDELVELVQYRDTVPHMNADWTWSYRPWHWECQARSAIGGLNHLQGRCTCCGGTDPPDPPELSRREAALVAYRFWSGGAHGREKIS